MFFIAPLMLIAASSVTEASAANIDAEKKVCRAQAATASRIPAKKICRSKAEWALIDGDTGSELRRNANTGAAAGGGFKP